MWISLDEASLTNGCLWGVPGSHTKDPIYYMRRAQKEDGTMYTSMDFLSEEEKEYDTTGAVPLEVEAGSIVLFHGNFTHFSDYNKSDESRHAYTLHIVENKEGIKYKEENWLQRVDPKECMGRTFEHMD
eukprot:CAMPEP_0170567440 /NCGR_PEP_ID=MMETSP0211-20121228/80479_1 /TAXON_ID=311385 /ORGANISM="Pseudokeronopsis sp., Strain OXSARD2" /LENGTH=128 /DNA_ID=CAMNT_0010888893 /DNA_START=511 /DNA_END=894 /DNA_ORIENTATION=+